MKVQCFNTNEESVSVSIWSFQPVFITLSYFAQLSLHNTLWLVLLTSYYLLTIVNLSLHYFNGAFSRILFVALGVAVGIFVFEKFVFRLIIKSLLSIDRKAVLESYSSEGQQQSTRDVRPSGTGNISISSCQFRIQFVDLAPNAPIISQSSISPSSSPTHHIVPTCRVISIHLQIIAPSQQWTVSKTYDDFYVLLDSIRQKYPSLLTSIPKLPSLRNILMKAMHNDNVERSPSTLTLNGTNFENLVWEAQQVEILSWLKQLQINSILCNDIVLRQFFNMSEYDSISALQSPLSSPTKSSSSPMSPTVSKSLMTSLLRRRRQINFDRAPLHEVDEDDDDDHDHDEFLISSTEMKFKDNTVVDNNTIAVNDEFTLPFPFTIDKSTGEKIYHSDDEYHLLFKGTCLDNFEFLDIPEDYKHMFTDIDMIHQFKVRSQEYLQEKTKTHPGPGFMKFILGEVIEVEDKLLPRDCSDRYDHLAAMGRVKRRLEILNTLQDRPFVLVANIQIPGSPPVCICTLHGVSSNASLEAEAPGFDRLWKQFREVPTNEHDRFLQWGLDGYPKLMKVSKKTLLERSASVTTEQTTDDSVDFESLRHDPSLIPLDILYEELPTKSKTGEEEFEWIEDGEPSAAFLEKKSQFDIRKSGLVKGDVTFATPYEFGALPIESFQNKRFKLIPMIVDGPWLVKLSVRSTPVLLGQKVAQRYFRGDNYLEIDVHVGSSMIASNIVGLCRGYSTSFICHMGIVIQGESEDELPEKLLCSYALNKIDVNKRFTI